MKKSLTLAIIIGGVWLYQQKGKKAKDKIDNYFERRKRLANEQILKATVVEVAVFRVNNEKAIAGFINGDKSDPLYPGLLTIIDVIEKKVAASECDGLPLIEALEIKDDIIQLIGAFNAILGPDHEHHLDFNRTKA